MYNSTLTDKVDNALRNLHEGTPHIMRCSTMDVFGIFYLHMRHTYTLGLRTSFIDLTAIY